MYMGMPSTPLLCSQKNKIISIISSLIAIKLARQWTRIKYALAKYPKEFTQEYTISGILQNTFSLLQNKKEIKTTTTTAIKNGQKYSPISEGNTCIAEPNCIGVLP